MAPPGDGVGDRLRLPVQAVSPQRRKPFNLAQGPGVLLVLTLRVLASVRIAVRREQIAAGCRAKCPKEAFLYYSSTSSVPSLPANAARGVHPSTLP